MLTSADQTLHLIGWPKCHLDWGNKFTPWVRCLRREVMGLRATNHMTVWRWPTGKMKWNESGFRPLLCTYRLNWARRTSWGWWKWLRWHCPPDTGFEIRAMAVWGRAHYLSVTEASHNTDFNTWMGKKPFLFLSNRRDREPNPELWRERQRC